jgi:hypothetical protein
MPCYVNSKACKDNGFDAGKQTKDHMILPGRQDLVNRQKT